MTYLPPPPPPGPLDYNGYVIQPNPRPTAVTVIAIIAIVFGSLGVLAGTCSLPSMFISVIPNPIMDAMREDSVLLAMLVIALIVGLLLGILELCAGVSALKLSNWGRSGLIWFAILRIATVVIGVILNVTVTLARNAAAIQRAMSRHPELNTPIMKMSMESGRTVGIAVPFLYLIWPGLILYFMTRPEVKAAFANKSNPRM